MDNYYLDNLPDVVHDNENYEYQILKDQVIGWGGQGCIVKVKKPENVVIKLNFIGCSEKNKVISQTENNGETLKNYKNKLKKLKSLPISNKQNITMPRSVLKDYAGYSLELLKHSESVNSLIISAKAIKEVVIPEHSFYQNTINEKNKQIVQSMFLYAQTGGLSFRLEVLYQIATILSSLHDKYLVFGDISPNNFMFEKTVSSVEVWAIDVDNINYSGVGQISGTPLYTAPEIARGLYEQKSLDGSGPTIYSDCYSFALLCFNVLFNQNPFKGLICQNPTDFEDDILQNIDLGLLPWIQDSNNKENHKKIKFDFFMDQHLFDLFDQCFSQGRENKEKRPLMFAWLKALNYARNRVITCQNCQQGLYFNPGINTIDGLYRCPVCGAVIPEIFCIYEIDSQNKQEKLIFAREITTEKPIYIQEYLLLKHQYKILKEHNFDKSQDVIILEKNNDNYILNISDNIEAKLEYIKNPLQQKSNTRMNNLQLYEIRNINSQDIFIYNLEESNTIPYSMLRNDSASLTLKNKLQNLDESFNKLSTSVEPNKSLYKKLKFKIVFSNAENS